FCNDVIRVGRSVPLVAWAFYADGQVEDVTKQVAWSVTPSGVGAIADGAFTGTADGEASITATLDEISSAALTVKVVSQPTIVQLSIYATQGGGGPPPFFPVFETDP